MLTGLDPRAACRELAAALAAAATVREASAAAERWRPPSKAWLAADEAEWPTAPPGAVPSARAPLPADGRIGIWVPQVLDGETWYVRDPAFNDSDTLWASTERIPPKGRRKRVVFLGESCARAFPYDPLFNCVAVLAAQLASVAGGTDVEVVDLARCGITAGPLRQMIEVSRALQPDVIVLFAGNNWQVHPDSLDYGRLASALATAGCWAAAAPEFERAVRTQVAGWVTALAAACRDTRTQAVFVLPANNQCDDWLPRNRYQPLLGSADQARREDLIARMDALHAAGDVAGAAAVAAELVALEDGFSIPGLQGLARAALARGDAGEAASFFDRAREQLVYLPLFGLDSYAIRLDETRSVAAREGLPLVDLPRWFREVSGGRPLGRDLFLDRVHMTARGVVAAMAATSEALLPLLGLPRASRRDLMAVPIDVEPRADAQAHAFYAWYTMPLDPQTARYHCGQAVAKTPEMAAVMRHYADLLLRRVPFVFCRSFHELQGFERRFPALRGLQRRALDSHQVSVAADTTLARFFSEAIAEQYPGAIAECEARVRAEHAVGERSVDLVPCAVGDEALDGVPVHNRTFMKHFRREVAFLAISPAASRPFRVRMTARTGRVEPLTGADHCGDPVAALVSRAASLWLNGELVQTWAVSRAWQTVECDVPARLVRDGANHLMIIWSDPGEQREERVRRVVAAFEDGRVLGGLEGPDVFTVYGEIAALTAGPIARPASADGGCA